MIRKIITSSGLALAIIISAIVEASYVTKHYFTLAFALAFFTYWSVELVIWYIKFRKTYSKKYQFYKARLINSSNITLEMIEMNNKKYYKRFKTSMLKDSLLRLLAFLGSIGIAITILVFLIV